MPQSYSMVGFGSDEITQAVKAQYGDDPRKEALAHQVGEIAAEFTHLTPVSSFQGAGAQKRRDYRKKCRDFISAKAKEKIPKPVGFIGGFVFMAILSGIISWWVQKLMHKYFDEQE